MFDNIVFFNNFFVVACIFVITSTILKVNTYNIEMQTLIGLICLINTLNSLGLFTFFSYIMIIA